MTKTNIEWCDESWNPLRGCSRVSAGCENCYAEAIARRFSGAGQPYEGLIAKGGQWNGHIKLVPEKLREPLHWKKPRRIFVNSMSDLFHEKVGLNWVAAIFAVMESAPQHTYIILTKRPAIMRQILRKGDFFSLGRKFGIDALGKHYRPQGQWPLPNVWLGVSVEDQKTADERIQHLLETPAAVRLISAEPLLGPIDIRQKWPLAPLPWPGINWIIAGGESGTGTSIRPSHPDWFRSLRDQCERIPFFFKQWGTWAPLENHPDRNDWFIVDAGGDYDIPDHRAPDEDAGEVAMIPIGKKKAGNVLDGKQHLEFPTSKNAQS